MVRENYSSRLLLTKLSVGVPFDRMTRIKTDTLRDFWRLLLVLASVRISQQTSTAWEPLSIWWVRHFALAQVGAIERRLSVSNVSRHFALPVRYPRRACANNRCKPRGAWPHHTRDERRNDIMVGNTVWTRTRVGSVCRCAR